MFIELTFQCMILYNKGNMLSWALSLRYTISEKITLSRVEQKDIYFEGLSTPRNENNTNNKISYCNCSVLKNCGLNGSQCNKKYP